VAAARLRHSVRFERRALSSDAYGNELADWQPRIGAIWAEVRPLRGSEEVLAAKLQGVAPYELMVRSSTQTRTITPGDRAIDARSGMVFDIRAIENRDMRNKFLTLTCQSGGASG
jgi:head-tail adaptor